MLTPANLNLFPYFYPIGNTPALSLTQSLPPDVSADILLLGCGDVRNILFTNYANRKLNVGPFSVHKDLTLNCFPDRKMDITCCDSQKAVIGELSSPGER